MWLWRAIRLSVLAAIVAYVVSALSWHDQVRLRDGTHGRLLSILEASHEVTLETERGILTVPRKDVATIEAGLFSLVKRVTWPETVAAIILTLLAPYLNAYRFHMVVERLGISLERRRIIDVALVSNVYLLFTPGSSGGDIYRTVALSRSGASWRRAAVAVVVDRLLGVLALAVWTGLAACLLINDPVFADIARSIALVSVSGVIALAPILYFRLYRYAFGGLRKVLPRFSDSLGNLEDVIDQILRDWSVFWKPILLSMVGQAMTLFAVTLVGLSLNIDHSVEAAWLLIPSAMILSVITPTPQGLGVLEGILVLFLAPLITGGANASVLLALGVRLLNMLWALPGALLMIRNRG